MRGKGEGLSGGEQVKVLQVGRARTSGAVWLTLIIILIIIRSSSSSSIIMVWPLPPFTMVSVGCWIPFRKHSAGSHILCLRFEVTHCSQ